MSRLYLCAVGNPEGMRLALEVNAAHRHWDEIVLLDDDPARHGQQIMGLPVIGGFDALADHKPGDQAVNLVARTTAGRDRARQRIESFGIPLVSLVHPEVNLHGVTLGQAVTLYQGCTVSALSTVLDHAVIFTRAVLGHGATLGRGAVLAPGAVINARVQVGDLAYVGTNAAVMPDLAVGAGATVSACSAVVGDVPAGSTALGVPAENLPAPGADLAEPADQAEPISADQMLGDLRALFAAVLGAPGHGADLSFFDAGGTSKLALELHRRIRADLGLAIGIVDLFRFPTPRQLATHLQGGAHPPSGPARPASRIDLLRRRREMRG